MIVIDADYMKIPESCKECCLWIFGPDICAITGDNVLEEAQKNLRHKDCPLKEIQEGE